MSPFFVRVPGFGVDYPTDGWILYKCCPAVGFFSQKINFQIITKILPALKIRDNSYWLWHHFSLTSPYTTDLGKNRKHFLVGGNGIIKRLEEGACPPRRPGSYNYYSRFLRPDGARIVSTKVCQHVWSRLTSHILRARRPTTSIRRYAPDTFPAMALSRKNASTFLRNAMVSANAC